MNHTRKRIFSALAVVLLLAAQVSPARATAAPSPSIETQRRVAALYRQQQGAAAAARAAQPPAPQTQTPLVSRTLANGLEVIVLEDHSVPLVTLELAVKNGSYTEPPELNGLSHLYEHMFFKPNRAVLEGAEYLKAYDQLGILSNASTREEIVNYYFHTTTPNLRVAMNFMRDAARYPLFAEDRLTLEGKAFSERQFEQERQAVLAELDRHEAEPGHYLEEALIDRLFYKYPSRKKPGGTRETVKAATTDTMRLIQSRYMVPNNAALIVTGDATPAAVFALAEEFFGDWAKAEDPFVKFPLVEHPPLARSEGAIIRQPVND
ncbi:MAG: M16 family metallopeptidase, partial [Pyrinomonadaceae bacterium]